MLKSTEDINEDGQHYRIKVYRVERKYKIKNPKPVNNDKAYRENARFIRGKLNDIFASLNDDIVPLVNELLVLAAKHDELKQACNIKLRARTLYKKVAENITDMSVSGNSNTDVSDCDEKTPDDSRV